MQQKKTVLPPYDSPHTRGVTLQKGQMVISDDETAPCLPSSGHSCFDVGGSGEGQGEVKAAKLLVDGGDEVVRFPDQVSWGT